jgi:hypothetical protein
MRGEFVLGLRELLAVAADAGPNDVADVIATATIVGDAMIEGALADGELHATVSASGLRQLDGVELLRGDPTAVRARLAVHSVGETDEPPLLTRLRHGCLSQ